LILPQLLSGKLTSHLQKTLHTFFCPLDRNL
jgi:hypothetical protein